MQIKYFKKSIVYCWIQIAIALQKENKKTLKHVHYSQSKSPYMTKKIISYYYIDCTSVYHRHSISPHTGPCADTPILF